MSEWQVGRLDSFFTLKRGYDLPKQSRISGSVPIIASSGFTDFHNEAKVNESGVVTGRYGTIGSVFFSEVPFWPLNTALYVNDFKSNDKKFIYYFLQTLDWEKFSDKSAVPGVNRNDVHQEEICFPSLPEQKALASVLSSLDDKIDLLHRQNKTLEAMAETLFRQWFIEEAKEDWKETKVLDVFSLVGGGTPKTSEASYWDGDIPWLSGGDIANAHQGFIVKAEKAITELGLEKSSTKLLPKLASVISARGTVGKYAMLSRPMTFSQSNYGIIPKGHTYYYFVYLLLAYIVDELSAAAYGSVFDTITTRTFEDVEIKLPSMDFIAQFESEIAPLFEKKLNNVEQIQTLENLRDTLLPKLMSGEVRVQYQTEEVA
ncbi:restriction endonuclease subunit S [Acinetobacter indicus]|nr:restriction endonuclease subunit S [Acinetobacter indicus]